ncbi:MAG: glycosyltransferase family 4 protein [Methanoregula sp.]
MSLGLYFLFYRPYCRYVLKKLQIDIIHSHFAPVGYYYHNIARGLGAYHVISFYGFDYEKLPYQHPEWNERYQELFTQADLFICEGLHGASILKEKGCPENKICIIPLGVEIEKIPFFSRSKKKDHLNLLQISSLVPKKGHIDTIEAFNIAQKDCNNITLTIVGSDYGNIKKGLEDKIEEFQIGDKVSFFESINFDKLYPFMHDYHVFIHPSCYASDRDCEGGAPVVILDAQATGMPVISTFHCDISSEVINRETGILTEEHNIPGLVDAIKLFYHMDNEEYLSFSQNARQHIKNNYDVKMNAKKLELIYQNLLEKNRHDEL